MKRESKTARTIQRPTVHLNYNTTTAVLEIVVYVCSSQRWVMLE